MHQAPQRIRRRSSTIPGTTCSAVVNGILDMSKIETDNFEITPEPFAPAQVIAGCCDCWRCAAREAGVSSRNVDRRRSAGDDCRQTRAQSDSAQSAVQRDPLHRPRRQGHGQRARRGGEDRLSSSKTTASASATKIWRASASRISRRARPTTAAMAAPASGSPSSRAWCGCTAAKSPSAAGSARARAYACRLPLDCERARPSKPRRAESIVSALNAVSQAANKAVRACEKGASRDRSVRDDRGVKKSA